MAGGAPGGFDFPQVGPKNFLRSPLHPRAVLAADSALTVLARIVVDRFVDG